MFLVDVFLGSKTKLAKSQRMIQPSKGLSRGISNVALLIIRLTCAGTTLASLKWHLKMQRDPSHEACNNLAKQQSHTSIRSSVVNLTIPQPCATVIATVIGIIV